MCKNKLKICAPSYYKAFKCIADKCKHSCCIDWEICIDQATYNKYKSIDSIISTINACDDGPCFALCENGKCPHLNNDGLCNIILTYGEDFLSDICKNHPRFYNEVYGGNIEVGLGIVCEEVCRLILENDTPFTLYEIKDSYNREINQIDFDALSYRNHIISVTESKNSFNNRLNILKERFKIPNLYTIHQWIDFFLKLEMLDTNWESTLRNAKGKTTITDSENDIYYSRLLTYFVYRHISIADSINNLTARLAFAILSVEIIRYLFENSTDKTINNLIDLARRYSAEIEYSEENTEAIIWEVESELL